MINKKIIAFICLVIVVIGGIILFATMGQKNSSSNTSGSTITDRDTGETVTPGDNAGISIGSAGSEFVSNTLVLGLTNLVSKLQSNSGKYTDYIRPAIQDFSHTRLNDRFSTITIRPQDLSISGNSIKSTIRLGQGDEILPISIEISSNKQSAIIKITDKTKKYGGDYAYVGGLPYQNMIYTISDTLNQSDDSIVIHIDAPEGYRNGAVDIINTLGYSPSRFTYVFENYKDPFSL